MNDALVIDGHPNPDSLTAEIARAYAQGYGDAQLLPLRDLDFDPHLRHGYTRHMPLEPDLVAAKYSLWAAKRVVVASPMWWGSVPALLKGFFDRVLLPGEEYTYRGALPVGLLRGRRGRIFLLADTPLVARPIIGIHAAAQLRRHTLEFCGIKPAPVTRMLGVRHQSEAVRARWIETTRARGDRDALADARRESPQPRTEPFADEAA